MSLPQPVAQRHAFVEYETFAAPAALLLRHAFEIAQDAALEVIDLVKSVRQQIGAGLLAADAAGAEHRDLPVLRRVEFLRGEILELPKALDAGIDRAFEGAHRHLEGVAGVDDKRVGRRDQRVPVGGIDIGADLPRRIDRGIAERDDFLLQPDLQPLERHLGSAREFEFEIVEPAAEQGAVLQFADERVDGFIAARNRAVDALMRQQHAALQPEAGAIARSGSRSSRKSGSAANW